MKEKDVLLEKGRKKWEAKQERKENEFESRVPCYSTRSSEVLTLAAVVWKWETKQRKRMIRGEACTPQDFL